MLQRVARVRASWFEGSADTLSAVLQDAVATDRAGKGVLIDEAVHWAADTARGIHRAGGKLIFIGNGGSAAIASHMATDYSKNGNLRALALNDGSILTCL